MTKPLLLNTRVNALLPTILSLIRSALSLLLEIETIQNEISKNNHLFNFSERLISILPTAHNNSFFKLVGYDSLVYFAK